MSRFPFDKKDLMYLYWSNQNTPAFIAEMYGCSESLVWSAIKAFDLGKKKHLIKHRGRRGYIMPEEERKKHWVQPHSVAVSCIDPHTFQTKKTYRSISSVSEDGFRRENVRRAVQICGIHKGYLWCRAGFEEGAVRVAKKRGLEKKLEWYEKEAPSRGWIERSLQKGKTVQQIADACGYSNGGMYGLIKRYGIALPKRPKLTEEILREEVLQNGLSAREIAEKYDRTISTIRTYITRYKIKRSSS